MKKILILLALLSGFAQADVSIFSAQLPDLQNKAQPFSQWKGKPLIINFWATWCSPCIKELPDFDSISKVYKNTKVKVLLVTMDFKEDLKSKVLPFILAKNLYSEVLLLDELNGNYFIPKISDAWSGAIPATLILNQKNNFRHFFEKKLSFAFLKTEIEAAELK